MPSYGQGGRNVSKGDGVRGTGWCYGVSGRVRRSGCVKTRGTNEDTVCMCEKDE